MNPELTDKIERYLNNEMQPQERDDFELELASDEELKRSLELYRGIDTTMSATTKEKELRQSLQQMNREYFAEGGNIKQGRFKKWLAIAASVLVIVFGAVYFLSSGKSSAEELYAEFARPAPLNIQMRGNTTDSLAQEAASAFNKKDYPKARTLLEEYIKLQPADVQMEFALGICYVETAEYARAEGIFAKQVSARTAFAEAAAWWLGLCWLKIKDYPQCKSYLERIPQTSPYYTRARELLEKLPE